MKKISMEELASEQQAGFSQFDTETSLRAIFLCANNGLNTFATDQKLFTGYFDVAYAKIKIHELHLNKKITDEDFNKGLNLIKYLLKLQSPYK